MTPVRTCALAATALLAALSLAGCSGPGAAPAPSTAAAFPRSVPLVPGRVLSRSTSSTEWRVWVAAGDPLRGYRQARRLLVAAGFVVTKDREGTGGGDGQLCTERLCVGVTGLDDPQHGPSVAYEVFRPVGIGG